ncbi:MAG: YggS family pyridoxal phosphate-dependent enzyme [Bdellovibrionia bacterium]
MTIAENYSQIKKRIASACQASGRNESQVTLIAVSKKQSEDKIEELYRLGHRDFGENYVQELIAKAEELERRGCKDIRWHFIGHLQTNKAKLLVPYVASVHSVDSEKIAVALAKAWGAAGRAGKLPVFIEVNISHEESKTGADTAEAEMLACKVSELPELELQGLMCVPAASEDDHQLKERFSELNKLEAGLRDVSRRQLSMGMSSDFEIAISQGSTHVRVGTALFGTRA